MRRRWGERLRDPIFWNDAVQLVTKDRDAVGHLLKMAELIDLVIPRGGEGLIRRVAEQARMPVLKHYKGVCHVVVERSADLAMARDILVNAKCQRPGVCNAVKRKPEPSITSPSRTTTSGA